MCENPGTTTWFRTFHLLGALLWTVVLFAQPTYNMQNALVTDCEGRLIDSESGPEVGQYAHNEDYTFTICQDGADEILIAFDFFATEATYDILTIYDGPDVNSPVIAILDGVIQPPPIFVATSGCVTFHFVSDDNILANGWSLSWSIDIAEPELPELVIPLAPTCPINSWQFMFDIPVDCDNFVTGNFNIIGPAGASISQINPLDCDLVTGLGQLFEVVFSEELVTAGSYRLLFEGAIQDACGEWHDVSTNVLYDLSNCPIEAFIVLDSVSCGGDCGVVHVEIEGSSALVYQYEWSHTNVDAAQVSVCTNDSILITVTVTDPVSLETAVAQFNYVALENPVFLNPLQRDTFCSGNSDHIYQVSLPGGEFYSRIIPDGHRTTGRYQFWRWSGQADIQEDIITYIAPNGCEVRDTVYIKPINAGSIQAACQNSSAFLVNGGSPSGGFWSGPHITAGGVFDPVEAGSFIVTYNALNGCTRNKRINVEQEIVMPTIDTICSTQEIDLRDFTTPYGGRWSGPGIVNSVVGRLQAWKATSGQTHMYVYDLIGCSDTIFIHIKTLWAGPDREMCDEDPLLILTETGNWSGPGTYLSGLNVFDIGNLDPGEYTYTLERDGCTDRFKLTIVKPVVTVDIPLKFCQEDVWYSLTDFVSFNPGQGVFTGIDVVDTLGDWFFNPLQMGAGTHLVEFEALGCTDSVWVEVEPYAQIADYIICELDDALFLEANPSGGAWSGAGFLDGNAGLFDPELLGVGLHEISYMALSGCVTLDTIEIFQFEEVHIDGLQQQYCYSDTLIYVDANPSGGSFFINGIQSNQMAFNPTALGEGSHELFYTKGTGACISSERKFISVLAPISGAIEAVSDSLCPGKSTVIEIQIQGGTGNLAATWDQALGFGSSHIVNPSGTTWYGVIVDDGCSEPFQSGILIYVHSPFEVGFVEGPKVCFEDSTFVQVVPPNSSNYSVEWQTDPPLTTPVLQDNPGFYTLDITERSSGCVQDYEVELPGSAPIKANFSVIPNQPCIDIIENEVQIIDLAVGYTDGTIDFGDGSAAESLIFGNLSHEYTDAGDYQIIQYVENELGCIDTISQWICVENKIAIYIPNVFSPNGDSHNDLFEIFAFGISNERISIFDRLGGLMFESNSLQNPWDGKSKGQLMDSGVYTVRVDYTNSVSGRSEVVWETVTLVR